MWIFKLIILLIALGTVSVQAAPQIDDIELGRINIRLSANIVRYTCTATTGDADKTVPLGTWPTKQFRNAGDTTQQMPFSLKLTGCPPEGTVSIAFSGTAARGDAGLLALKTGSTATNVAVELLNQDKTRLNLTDSSQQVKADVNGDAVLMFYANYIALGGPAAPGSADADATFKVSYE